ncbi:DNA/RNA non-specific endonuclease [Actinomyces wuliandei]|uniref:DNA/RNA non-specific endonuclease n=1 Tax=Actinomyces wuliandei TaxID=2057743 RepID=UPI001118D9E2|nr:DNA/RNA non-specific endonuclease [Actinomyces wuliandei]
MAATPFNETKIPCLEFDVESLDTAATNLKTKAGDLRSAGESVKSTWAGMQVCYKAPEQESLYAAMDPVADDSDSLATSIESMASALSTFADTVSSLRTRAQALRSDVLAFKEEVAGDPEWDHDQDLVNKNNGFIDRASAIQADMWEAERECANTIRALDCLAAYQVDSGAGGDLAYGYSAEDMKGAEGLPWGERVDRQDSCPKSAVTSTKRFVWDGLVVDGVGGTVNGIAALVGVEFCGEDGFFSFSGDTAKQTWQGLAGLVGATWDENGNLDFQKGTAAEAWKEMGKGLVAWDMWSEDPARAAGSLVPGVLGTVATGGSVAAARGAGAAGKGAARLGKGSRALRAAAVAQRVADFMDPVGTALSKGARKVAGLVGEAFDFSGLGDLVDRIRGRGGAEAPEVPAPHSVDVGPGRASDLPEVGGSRGHGPHSGDAGGGTGGRGQELPGQDVPVGKGAQEPSASHGGGRSGQADGAQAGEAGARGRHRADSDGEGADTDGTDAPVRHRADADGADGARSPGSAGRGDGAEAGAPSGRRRADGDSGAEGSSRAGHDRGDSAGAESPAGRHRGDSDGAEGGSAARHRAGGDSGAEAPSGRHRGDSDGGSADTSAGRSRSEGADGDAPARQRADDDSAQTSARHRADGDSAETEVPSGRHRGDSSDGDSADAGARGRHRADSEGADGDVPARHRGDEGGEGGSSTRHRGDEAEGADSAGGAGRGDGGGGTGRGGGGDGEGPSGRGSGGDGDGDGGSSGERSVAERLEERRQKADQDGFNQEHRPRVERTVEVGKGSDLAPRHDMPFGRGVELEPNTCYQVDRRGSFYTNDAGEVVHVEAHSAVERRGWWDMHRPLNPDLRDPLPSATYTVDGRFHYTTDEWGRTVRVQVDLMRKSSEKYRAGDLQSDIGNLGGEDYHGGHLAGHQFGGAPEDINVVPMLDKLNLGGFHSLEEKIAANPHAYKHLDIRIEYDGPPGVDPGTSLSGVPEAGRVPTEFTVYADDAKGVPRVPRTFPNR